MAKIMDRHRYSLFVIMYITNSRLFHDAIYLQSATTSHASLIPLPLINIDKIIEHFVSLQFFSLIHISFCPQKTPTDDNI